MTKKPQTPPVRDLNWPDPRHPPCDPDFPQIWSFKTLEQVERWLAANKKDDDVADTAPAD
jgi:hypothetical protein